MKNDFSIKNAKDFTGQEVELKGWVFNKRSGGSIVFLQVRDGTGFMQVIVVKQEVKEEVFQKAQELTLESSVICTGTIKDEKRAVGGFELSLKELVVINLSAEDYPIGKKEHGPDFLLSHRHLWLRSKRQWAILRIRNTLINGINEFLQKENFSRIDTPIITPSACEGTTTLFEIDYFGEKAYLTQSGQLYLETAIYSFGRCYDFGPALRAEKSKTRRHLIEFWIMDAEAAFMDFEELLKFEEKFIFYLIQKVLNENEKEFIIIGRDTKPLESIKTPFDRLTYDNAIKRLNSLGSDIKWGSDFGNDDETILMNHFNNPIFITDYPASIKAFYCKKRKDNEKLVLSGDLMAPEGYGEIIGGGQREDDYNKLLKSIKDHKYMLSDYEWYLDLRKYGSVPHSGFGLGLERLIAWICKLDHVRETIPFPRMMDRFRP